MSGETPQRVEIALAIPVYGDRVLVARRSPEQHLGGLWEFPGGVVEAGELPADAALRELSEETGLEAHAAEPLVIVVHDYTDRPVRLHVFLARGVRGEVQMSPGREWGWKTLAELHELEMPEANRQVLQALRWRLPGPGGATP